MKYYNGILAIILVCSIIATLLNDIGAPEEFMEMKRAVFECGWAYGAKTTTQAIQKALHDGQDSLSVDWPVMMETDYQRFLKKLTKTK